jgi:hypothetical protein
MINFVLACVEVTWEISYEIYDTLKDFGFLLEDFFYNEDYVYFFAWWNIWISPKFFFCL